MAPARLRKARAPVHTRQTAAAALGHNELTDLHARILHSILVASARLLCSLGWASLCGKMTCPAGFVPVRGHSHANNAKKPSKPQILIGNYAGINHQIRVNDPQKRWS